MTVARAQGDTLNDSRLATTVCVPLTSNLTWANAPGSVPLPGGATGLGRDSVANATQLVTIDRALLSERVGRLSVARLDLVLSAIDVVLGR